MKTTIILSVLLAFISTGAIAQKKPKDKVLGNKTYTVEITENNTKKPYNTSDEISFKMEKINTKNIGREYQFVPLDYTVEVDSTSSPVTISFSSEGKSKDDETIKWEGTVTGEEIEGTVFMTNKKGKTTHDFSFTGSLKGKPGKK